MRSAGEAVVVLNVPCFALPPTDRQQRRRRPVEATLSYTHRIAAAGLSNFYSGPNLFYEQSPV